MAGGIVSKILHLLELESKYRQELIAAYLSKGMASPCVRDISLFVSAVPGDRLTYNGLLHYYFQSVDPLSLTLLPSIRHQVLDDYDAMSIAARDYVVEKIKKKPDSVLCLATGSTPTFLYNLLSKEPPELFSNLRIVQLDEWRGFEDGHPALCRTYLRSHSIAPWSIAEDRFLSFDSNPTDAEVECQRIETRLQAWGGIDLSILGLGTNGHIGFLEPNPEGLPERSHVAKLAASSQGHSMLNGSPCQEGLTLGMHTLLAARETLLLVSGQSKATALQDAISQPPTSLFPASVLLRGASNVTLLCDRAAAVNTDL